MPNTFSSTDSTAHMSSVPVSAGNSYNFYVRCLASGPDGIANTSSLNISFMVQAPTLGTGRIAFGGGNTFKAGTSAVLKFGSVSGGQSPDSCSPAAFANGPQLWLDASQITPSGSTVTRWADSSQGLRDYIAGAVNAPPDYTASGINSLPSVQFKQAASGGPTMLVNGINGLPYTGSFTFFGVIKPASPSLSFGTIIAVGSSDGVYYLGDTQKIGWYNSATATTYSSNVTIPLNSVHTFAFVSNGGSGTIYIDGSAHGTFTAQAVSGARYNNIGNDAINNSSFTDSYNGLLSYLVAWDSAFDLTNINAFSTCLRNTYGTP
jgi:hypothetical protein